MLFAKFVLVAAILVAVVVGLYMRVRASWRKRKEELAKFNAELARDLRSK